MLVAACTSDPFFGGVKASEHSLKSLARIPNNGKLCRLRECSGL